MIRKLDSARGVFRAALHLLLVAVWLGLSARVATAAIIKDYVRVSVKYLHDANGFRPPGVYGIETSIATAFSDMNIILDRHDLRWRLLLVEVKDVSDSSEFFDLDDSNFGVFERRARDEEPTKYHWRNDAINIYIVNTIEDAGGRASFPGGADNRDIVAVASSIINVEINNLSAGWLHEIGHYLSLKHTFQCSGADCDSDQEVCQGEGAKHRGWSARCPDVCPHDENIMSYDDLGLFGAEATRIGTFTECQIEHMNYELYDPRGDRNHVLQPCSESCAELAAPCREACAGTFTACTGACDVVDTICDGGCGAAGDACRGACTVPYAACTGPCLVAEESCLAGCDTVCFFAPDSEECRACRSACRSAVAECRAPCDAVASACNRDCPTPSSCRAECDHQKAACHEGCVATREACLEPCRAIEQACLGDCPESPADPTNWALRPGVTTRQSSDHTPAYTSNLAIDGRLDTFSHTLARSALPAFLEVDLGVELEIETIVLENRRDCCGSRLRDITLSILDAQGETVYKSAAALNAKNAEGRTTLDGPARLVHHLPHANAGGGGKVTGRIIRIERAPDPLLEGTGGQGNGDEADVLSLAEVAVYGNTAPPPSDVNLTRHNNSSSLVSARQSSTEFGGVAERAIDGDQNGSYPSGSVTHTMVGDPTPWWELDLGQTYPIGKVVIWNRTDCCQDRLYNFRLKLLDGNRSEVHSSWHFTDGSFPETSTAGYEIAAFGDDARFVRIELWSLSGGPGVLSLAEVEVFTGPKGGRFVRGDADSSGVINIADGIVTLAYLFLGGVAPACGDAADANDDGSLAISDAVTVFTWLFSGGRAPAPPTPGTAEYDASDCGPDETQDVGLDCATPGAACS